MELFKFYKVDDSAKTIFYAYDKRVDSGGIRFYTIICGVSYPPEFTSIYDAGCDEATKDEISNVLRFRYGAMIEFVFENIR